MGKKVNKPSSEVLCQKVQEGKLHEVRGLLQKDKSHINIKNSKGWPALVIAASEGQKVILKLLLENGAHPDVKTSLQEKKVTALINAAYNGDTGIVNELLQFGADPSVRDEDGFTAYQYAVMQKHVEIADRIAFQQVKPGLSNLTHSAKVHDEGESIAVDTLLQIGCTVNRLTFTANFVMRRESDQSIHFHGNFSGVIQPQILSNKSNK